MILPLLLTAIALSGLADVRTVAVGLPPEVTAAVAAVLEQPLARVAPGVVWEFEFVPAERLGKVLAGAEEHRVAAVLAYGVPLLVDPVVARHLRTPPPCATARGALGGADLAHVLWFDPLVLVWSDGGTGVETRPSWVPEQLGALCEGGLDGRLLLQKATPWNVTGALVTSLAEAGGGASEAEGRLVGLDGNRAIPHLERPEALLRRLSAVEPGPVAVISRSVLARFRVQEAESAARLHSFAPRDRFVAVLLGAAALETDAAGPLFEALGDPSVLAEISRASSLLPVSETLGDAQAPDTAAFRIALSGEAPRLAGEQALASATVDRYVHQIVGRHEQREALFSEVFDALGIAAMAVFVIWVLREREGASQ